MEPISAGIAGGAILGSAVLNWMNSSDAAEATAAERRRVAALFAKIQQPNFNPQDLNYEDYQVVSQFVPEVAPYVESIAPQAVDVSSEDAKQGRSAQRQALEQMMQMARSGNDPLTEIARAQSSRNAAGNAQSARATLDQQMERRGVGAGSGMQYAANQAAISDAFMADALAGEQAAADAANRRMNAGTQAANIGSNLYGQEMSLAEKNAQIMNDYNRYLRDSKQTWANQRANTVNSANQLNFTNAQDTANKNTGLRNSEKDNRRAQEQQRFENQITQARGQAGLSDSRVGDINARTQQQNQAVQGLGEGIAKVAMSWNDKDDKLKRN